MDLRARLWRLQAEIFVRGAELGMWRARVWDSSLRFGVYGNRAAYGDCGGPFGPEAKVVWVTAGVWSRLLPEGGVRCIASSAIQGPLHRLVRVIRGRQPARLATRQSTGSGAYGRTTSETCRSAAGGHDPSMNGRFGSMRPSGTDLVLPRACPAFTYEKGQNADFPSRARAN